MAKGCVLCGVKIAFKYGILDTLSVAHADLGYMAQSLAPFCGGRIDIIGNQ